ncbi:Lrp/AsnC family transcriptional regulator [Aeromicrobium fastidiosum]|uniref:Lrp/AsnC family transcriptional regulator n=1 Tax=Aeromicrobium fastidiosum TaxID=52699 RepID=A0A641AH86_9ACTN|nr:Lrp/AsnC family transcriptional regulator [Aeromicrobium fastidiosum]KAA1373051.1 Lrp/AsnC family transcriptional regulator [Aeromicrobium fastidiosum]MBP2391032.1 DNA-binding Lrp family transcriptional regulator [Aeromicrobium fastidiosum]
MADTTLDAIDQRILGALERDGRLSMRQLAEQVHISRANAYARVERLTESGVITGFSAVVDPVARGLKTSAYVTMHVNQPDWRDIHAELRTLEGVEHIALVGGEFDVVLLVRARDNADLRRLVLDQIQGIHGVISTRTLLLFEESSPTRHGAQLPGSSA